MKKSISIILLIVTVFIIIMYFTPSSSQERYKEQLQINKELRIKNKEIRDSAYLEISKRDTIIAYQNKKIDSIDHQTDKIELNLIKKETELKNIKGKFDKLNNEEISKALISAFLADTIH